MKRLVATGFKVNRDRRIDRTCHWGRWTCSKIPRSLRLNGFSLADDLGGNSDGCCALGHVYEYDCIGSNPRVIAHPDTSEHLRSRADPDVVADDRSHLFIPANPDRHFLIDSYIVSNHATIVEDDTEPIVTKMNVFPSDPSLVWNEATETESQELLNEERKHRNFPAIECIRGPINVVGKIGFYDHFPSPSIPGETRDPLPGIAASAVETFLFLTFSLAIKNVFSRSSCSLPRNDANSADTALGRRAISET